MELNKAIIERRSVRKYLDKDIALRDLLELIESAHYAPSSGNLQNWRFIIVKNPELKKKIAEACLDQSWMTEAPVHIVICSDRAHIQSFYEKHKNKYSIQNCALAAQNIMLKAHSLKLGTCFVSGFSKLALKRALEIPESSEPEAIITLGYPSETPKCKRNNIETYTYFEKYGNKKADKELWPFAAKLKSLFSKFKK
ncbi:MAG: nitroreductase family protein [Nanoarchaeota archaeon]|nr:nitroreductase family protein [Nanoarchaeota archaeon]